MVGDPWSGRSLSAGSAVVQDSMSASESGVTAEEDEMNLRTTCKRRQRAAKEKRPVAGKGKTPTQTDSSEVAASTGSKVDAARFHSPSPRGNSSLKQYLDDALENLEDRLTASISRDLHDFREVISSEVSALNDRIRDLEQHVEEKDIEVAKLETELHAVKKEMISLQEKTENAEMNSRIPCLILSGRAMAPRRGPRLGAPLPPADRPEPRGVAVTCRAGSSGAPADSGRGGRESASAEGEVAGRQVDEPEDVSSLVIDAVRSRLRGLEFQKEDIDRAHRLPGPNNKVIVRFVRSGPGSVRDQLMSRRLELSGYNDLFINESLTASKSQIFRSLLEAKKQKQIYTVFTRWGHVFYKAEKYGTNTRVESIQKLRSLKLPVKE